MTQDIKYKKGMKMEKEGGLVMGYPCLLTTWVWGNGERRRCGWSHFETSVMQMQYLNASNTMKTTCIIRHMTIT